MHEIKYLKAVTKALLSFRSMSLESVTPSVAIGACVPCARLDHNDLIPFEQVQQRVQESIPLWSINDRRTGSSDWVDPNETTIGYYSLYRKFTAKNFQAAMNCITAVGVIAEEQQHHPDLHVTNYRDVCVEIYTHKLKGITENDIVLAQSIDAHVAIEYSPKWLQIHPEVLQNSKTS
jgi:pterin-4a-carbinolamine dehydratase